MIMSKITLVALFALFTTIIGEDPQYNWEKLPGVAKFISAKGNQLWAITKYSQPMRWNDGSGKWQLFNSRWGTTETGEKSAQLVDHIAATNRGSIDIYGIGVADRAFCTMSNVDNANVGWNCHGWVITSTTVNAVDITGIVTVRAEKAQAGCVWFHGAGGWKALEKPCDALQAAIGEGNDVWKVDTEGKIYRYDWASPASWRLIDAPVVNNIALDAAYIDVQNKDKVVVTSTEGTAFLYRGGAWERISDFEHPWCSQATINNDYVYCLHFNGQVWRSKLAY